MRGKEFGERELEVPSSAAHQLAQGHLEPGGIPGQYLLDGDRGQEKMGWHGAGPSSLWVSAGRWGPGRSLGQRRRVSHLEATELGRAGRWLWVEERLPPCWRVCPCHSPRGLKGPSSSP